MSNCDANNNLHDFFPFKPFPERSKAVLPNYSFATGFSIWVTSFGALSMVHCAILQCLICCVSLNIVNVEVGRANLTTII